MFRDVSTTNYVKNTPEILVKISRTIPGSFDRPIDDDPQLDIGDRVILTICRMP